MVQATIGPGGVLDGVGIGSPGTSGGEAGDGNGDSGGAPGAGSCIGSSGGVTGGKGMIDLHCVQPKRIARPPGFH